MSCRVYLQKYIYEAERGKRKKAESENGFSLLGYALKDSCGIDISTLDIARGQYGKPYFTDKRDICFNISHSGDYAAAAICENPVGVDVQVIRTVKDGLIERLCGEEEQEYVRKSADKSRAFIRLWALKESYIKAIGKGMAFPMDEVCFSLGDPEETICRGCFSNREGLYYMRDFGKFVLAVCVLTDIRGELCT